MPNGLSSGPSCDQIDVETEAFLVSSGSQLIRFLSELYTRTDISSVCVQKLGPEAKIC